MDTDQFSAIAEMRETARTVASGREQASIRVALLCDLPSVAWGLEQLITSRTPAMAWAGTAHSVGEAHRLMKSRPADVVLLDLDGDIGAHGIAELLNGGRTRVLALTTSRDPAFCDAAVLAGASGVVNKRDATAALLKAIEKVHDGEIWLDRGATGRIFVAMARKRAARDPEEARIARLTRKERLTVSEVARDPAATSREVAQRLCISEHTLRNHLTSIYSKLDLRNRTELYAYAHKQQLVAAGRVSQPAPGVERARAQ
jgi:two-component system nitrate/nitrite response regulator NarL